MSATRLRASFRSDRNPMQTKLTQQTVAVWNGAAFRKPFEKLRTRSRMLRVRR